MYTSRVVWIYRCLSAKRDCLRSLKATHMYSRWPHRYPGWKLYPRNTPGIALSDQVLNHSFGLAGLKSTRHPNGNFKPLKWPFLCRRFQQLSPFIMRMLHNATKQFMAFAHQLRGNPDWRSSFLVPTWTRSTSLSAMPLAWERYCVLFGLFQPRTLAAFMSSPAWSV